MEVQPDFKELLTLLNAKSVEYLIAGGYAVAFHGAPRFTGDIDIYVRPSSDNAQRVMGALDDFGFGGIGIGAEDFQQPENVVQLGVPPIRVDIITSISGVSCDDAFSERVHGEYGGVPVYYLSRDCLIANKRAAGRRKDLADLEALGEEV